VAIVESSSKLSAKQHEFRICSKGIVFFRLVDEDKYFRLMTATAPEDTKRLRPFSDQKRLIAATQDVLSQLDVVFSQKQDHAGKPYVEAKLSTDKKRVEHIANTVLLQLGL